MTTPEQLEQAICDWMQECETRMGNIDSCPGCYYEEFCKRFHTLSDDIPDAWIIDKERGELM